MQCQPNLSSTTSTKVLQKLRKRPSSAVRLASGSGIGPIDDIDGRMEWQRARLLAGNANDLAPCHDYIVNHLASGKTSAIRLAPMLTLGNDWALVRSLSGRMYRLA